MTTFVINYNEMSLKTLMAIFKLAERMKTTPSQAAQM